MEVNVFVICGSQWRAGIHGLIVAKTFIQVHPQKSLLIIDKAHSIGGVWARERLYPGLKTNNVFGSYEFSDFPVPQGLADKDKHIPGPVVHEYLRAFARHFGLEHRLQLRCCVERAEYRGDKGWALDVLGSDQRRTHLEARNLVVAGGLHSEPFIPDLKDAPKFGRPIFHSKELASRFEEAKGARSVAIIGANKSAMDVASLLADSGVHVDWIIRESGNGSGWCSPAVLQPLNFRFNSLSSRRVMILFSPCIWAADGFSIIRRFLQKTWLGRKTISTFFSTIQRGIIRSNRYDTHHDIARLKPRTDLFWHGSDVNILNYDHDVFEYVQNGRIKVRNADIVEMNSGTISLSDGSKTCVELLVCATGWVFSPALEFVGISKQDLGIPTFEGPSTRDLRARADREIFEKFPILGYRSTRDSTKGLNASIDSDSKGPYRLYRFTVPPKMLFSQSISFAGAHQSILTCAVAQAQALWIVAFFDHKMVHLQPSNDTGGLKRLQKEVEYEALLHSQFCKRRCPHGSGPRNPDFSSDSIPFIDLLLSDLGLRTHRKPNMLSELFESYTLQDYKGLVSE